MHASLNKLQLCMTMFENNANIVERQTKPHINVTGGSEVDGLYDIIIYIGNTLFPMILIECKVLLIYCLKHRVSH